MSGDCRVFLGALWGKVLLIGASSFTSHFGRVIDRLLRDGNINIKEKCV